MVRAQSAIEFLMTYGWAILIMLVFIGTLYYFGAFGGAQFVPRSCYIAPGISCDSFRVSANESGASVVFAGKNQFGYDIGFDADAVVLSTENLGGEGKADYPGDCSPSIVRRGRGYTCVIEIPDTARIPREGAMQRTQFSLSYKNCESNPDYVSTRNCSANLTLSHTVKGEMVSQAEPYFEHNFCGNDECDDVFGENDISCHPDCGSRLLISADPDAIPNDGTTASLITASVLNHYYDPIPGVNVSFTQDGSASLTVGNATTDASGNAYTSLTDIYEEVVGVTAATTSPSGMSATVNVTVGIGVVETLILVPNPATIPDDGTTPSIITATVRDSNGLPINGMQVNFSIFYGAGNLSSLGGITNSFGQVEMNLTSSTVGTVVVMGETTTLSNTTQVEVTIVSTPGGICDSTIDGCCMINAPGTYTLDTNLNPAQVDLISIYYPTWDETLPTCIYINSSGVTLNCGGNGIAYAGSPDDDSYGIGFDGVDGVAVSGCTLQNFGYGVVAMGTDGSSLQGNAANSNKYNGIYAESASNSEISGNTANTNAMVGITLWSSSGNSFIGNNADSNGGYGIQVGTSSSNTITGNTADSNNHTGIYMYGSGSNNLTSNTADANIQYGIWLTSSASNNLIDNGADSNGVLGIYIHDSSDSNTLMGNTADSNNHTGIYLFLSTGNNVTNNRADNNTNAGVYLESSNSNQLTGNNASSNSVHGIYLSASNNIAFDNNRACGNTLDLECWWDSSSTGNSTFDTNSGCLDVDQTANCSAGLPNEITECTIINSSGTYTLSTNLNPAQVDLIDAYYPFWDWTAPTCIYINSSGVTLNCGGNGMDYDGDPDADYVIGIGFDGVDNVAVSGCTVQNFSEGIIALDTEGSSITGNTANSNVWNGIYLAASNGNNLTSNTANSNTYNGITLLEFSEYNNLIGNTATLNDNIGIWLGSSNNNNLTDNDASSNAGGIYLRSSSGNNLTGNNASSNTGGGVVLEESSNSNNLTDNNANSNNDGISVWSSNSNNLTGNNASLNGNNGIWLGSSSDISLGDNTMCSNNQSGGVNYYDLNCTLSSATGNSTFDTNSSCTVTKTPGCPRIPYQMIALTSTADFYAGTKSGTATISDEYNHTSDALELSFPYAGKDANLVSYWRLENNANDETGSNPGTVSGATYTSSGKFDGAYIFAASKYVKATGSSSNITGNMTISAWVYPTSLGTGNQIVSRGGGSAADCQYLLNMESGKPNFYAAPGGYAYGTALTANSWYHLVAVRSGTTLSIYVMGVKKTDGTMTGTPVTPATANLTIGAYDFYGHTYNFVGTIDEVKIYGRSLTATEITALYNGGNKYTSSGNWTSATQPMTAGYKLANLTLTLANGDASNYISKIEILNASSSSVLTTWTGTMSTTATLTDANFSSGFDPTASTDIKVRLYLVGAGTGTISVEDITGWAEGA